jgi:hypothetical protein
MKLGKVAVVNAKRTGEDRLINNSLFTIELELVTRELKQDPTCGTPNNQARLGEGSPSAVVTAAAAHAGDHNGTGEKKN